MLKMFAHTSKMSKQQKNTSFVDFLPLLKSNYTPKCFGVVYIYLSFDTDRKKQN